MAPLCFSDTKRDRVPPAGRQSILVFNFQSVKCELKEENCGEMLAYTQSVLCKEPEYECENATPDFM